MYNIAFDFNPGCASPQHPLPPPLGLELRVLNSTGSNSPSYLPSLSVKNLFQEVYDLKLQLSSENLNSVLEPYTTFELSPASDDPVYSCCYLAVTIFWVMICGKAHPTTSYIRLDDLAAELRASLALTDNERWLRYFPAAYTWVCITGAAAASSSNLRIWFYFRQASAVRLLTVQNKSDFADDLWSHFYWLRALRRSLPLNDE